jgi:hypothetical protein
MMTDATQGMGRTMNVVRLAMGEDRKHRWTWPRETTWLEPQAEQR